MEKGWICLHRKIRDHWLWNDPVKLKWWLDILLQVNHDKKTVKVNIGLQIIECGRGQTIMSLRNWSERWNISKDSARHFLTLLQDDGMIKMENVKKSTRITVCNYGSYNKPAHARETDERQTRDRRETDGHPNNNDNKDLITINNENKDLDENKLKISEDGTDFKSKKSFNRRVNPEGDKRINQQWGPRPSPESPV